MLLRKLLPPSRLNKLFSATKPGFSAYKYGGSFYLHQSQPSASPLRFLRPFSTGKDNEADTASAAEASDMDFKTLEEKMKAMEEEIEASAKANREFVNLDGVNLYDELKEEVKEGASQ